MSLINFALRHLPSFVVSLLLTLLIKKCNYKTTDLLSLLPGIPCSMKKTKKNQGVFIVVLIKQFVKYACVAPTSSTSRIVFMATHFLRHLRVMKNLET